MSQFSRKILKLGDYSMSSSRKSEKNRRRRQRRKENKYKKLAGASADKIENSTKITIFNDETKISCDNFDIDVYGNDSDEEMAIQQILLDSAQFHRAKYSESSQNAGKKVLSCCVTYGGLTSKAKSIREKGGPSCTYCVICDDAKVPNTLKRGSSCEHYYCEECIRSYIGEKIHDDINEVKCPVSNCKKILDIASLMPNEFMDLVKDAIRETEVLASPKTIECPSFYCTGELIDDKRGFLIRACPKCWRIFCVKCRDWWHMGSSCYTNQYFGNKATVVPRLLSFHYYDDDDDDDHDTETGFPMLIPIIRI